MGVCVILQLLTAEALVNNVITIVSRDIHIYMDNLTNLQDSFSAQSTVVLNLPQN